MAPDIININIKSGDGLSQAIDRQLDKELNQDVKFNLSEWNSVFNVIKNDNATEKKQYTGDDSDIKDSKQFVVQEGEYKITKNAWDQIVEFAKKNLGISTQNKTEQKSQDEQIESSEVVTKDVKSQQTSEEIVKNILSSAEIEIDSNSEDFKDIINKYNAIKSVNPDIDEETLNTRITNYVRGLQFHKAETQFATNDGGEAIIIDGVQEAVQNGDMEAFKTAFHQKAKEYIELYDSADGDGKISVNELIQMEEKELGRALTEDEKDIVKENAVNFIAVLNQDEDNGTLNENEVAAYLWAMSKINDGNNKKTAHDITFEEWNTSRESMGILSGTTLTDEEWEIVNPAFSIIKKTGKTLDELYTINDLSGLNISEEEKNILENALPLLNDNGFNQEMINNYGKFAQALKNGYEGLKS